MLTKWKRQAEARTVFLTSLTMTAVGTEPSLPLPAEAWRGKRNKKTGRGIR